VIAKTTQQTAERLFRSPKSQRASPREESIWRKEWAVSESPNDSAMATLITQSYRNWRTDGQGKLTMEGSGGRIADLVDEARLTSPNGISGQKLNNYKLKFLM